MSGHLLCLNVSAIVLFQLMNAMISNAACSTLAQVSNDFHTDTHHIHSIAIAFTSHSPIQWWGSIEWHKLFNMSLGKAYSKGIFVSEHLLKQSTLWNQGSRTHSRHTCPGWDTQWKHLMCQLFSNENNWIWDGCTQKPPEVPALPPTEWNTVNYNVQYE